MNGVLYVNDTKDDEKAKYCKINLFDDSCDPRQDAVYEFSCKALSVAVNADSWNLSSALFVFSSGFSTGTDSAKDYDIYVSVSLDEGVGFTVADVNGDVDWLKIGGVEQRVAIAQTGGDDSAWTKSHLFRVVKDGDYVVLYVDNRTSPYLRFDLDLLADNILQDQTTLLTTSNPGKSEFELMHFRYRIAATSFNSVTTSPCEGDIDGDSDVDAEDLLALLAAWGPCTSCDEDLDSDGNVGTSDLVILLTNWGDC